MKANVQYNDFRGTTAADISDFIVLEDYLKNKGLDIEKYTPIGIRFYSNYDSISVDFICIDRECEEEKAIRICFEKEMNINEFLNLFKRFEVILIKERFAKCELVDDSIIIREQE